jgi:hypothetical protein
MPNLETPPHEHHFVETIFDDFSHVHTLHINKGTKNFC